MKTLSFGHLSRLGLVAVALRLGVVGASNWVVGDVFVGVGSGLYKVYENDGDYKETIDTLVGGFTTGCGFNNDHSKLYATGFGANKVAVLNATHPHTVLQTLDSFQSPESVVFDVAGNFYIGHADNPHDIIKYNPAGVSQANIDVAIELTQGGRGSDWIELATDQSTMYYTSEGRIIFRYDIVTGTQLANYANLGIPAGLPAGAHVPTAFALRLLPPGDGTGGLLVADRYDIKRLDSNGAVVQTYQHGYNKRWFALVLDPNGSSFWAGDSNSGKFSRINISTGVVEVGPISTVPATSSTGLFGLCVLGEPTGGTGGAQGDPHLKTWRGQHYDYHGECDLVLLHSKEFASGLGLDVHIRTKIRRDMSYISSAALRIGSDVLEVQSQGVYYLNGFANAVLPSEFSGFEFSHTQPTDKQHVFELHLGGQERIKLKTYKDFVSVLIEQGKKDHFGDSVGLMGDFQFGVKLARDGKTVLNDANAFGQEWQVLDTEPTLFQTVRFPQHPQTCTLPSPEAKSALRRRLSESSADELAAEKACAHWGEGKDDCVFDVLATGDLEMAVVGAY